MEQRKYRRKDN